jgi:hypothetical protein
VLMIGTDHALLLDEDEELVIEDSVYADGTWMDRVHEGYPVRDALVEEC